MCGWVVGLIKMRERVIMSNKCTGDSGGKVGLIGGWSHLIHNCMKKVSNFPSEGFPLPELPSSR